jgi:general secretion pathway protein F
MRLARQLGRRLFLKHDMEPQNKKTLLSNSTKRLLLLFGVSSEERNFFVENLSLLLDSELGVTYSLETLKEEAKTWRMRAAIGDMISAVRSGAPFWKALAAPRIFPERLISIVKAGEDAGELSESIRNASAEMEKERKFRSKLRSALMYPGVIFVVAIAVVMIASATVLPKLTVMFKSSKVKLPLSTRILIGFGNVMQKDGIWLVPLVLACIASIYYLLFIYKKTKPIGDSLLFHLPLIRTIIQETEIARFGYSAGSQLKAGISVINVFESLAEGASMSMYRDFYLYIRDRIRQGDSIHQAMISHPKARTLLSFQVIQIIASSEKTGKLAETCMRVGMMYEEKSDAFAKNIGTLIEPIVVIVIGAIVALVVVSIIAPIYALTSAI